MFAFWLFANAATCADEKSLHISICQPRVFSVAEYISKLNHLTELARGTSEDTQAAADGINELRGGWEVRAGGQVYPVPTDVISDQFERLQKHSDDQLREGLLNQINTMKADAQAFAQAPLDTTATRSALNAILALSEFHQVHGPTWLDRLKYRIMDWLFRLLSRFFDSSSVPVIGRSLVWALVAVALAVLAWFIYREMKRNARIEITMPDVLPVSTKRWSVWMAEAHAAAENGLWRDAVHLAYWAGISSLEERGAWRPDKARTPREYLRLISTVSEYQPALFTLTRQFEVTWYGNRAVGPEAFAESITYLESLGCRQS
jgi:hypothetical protein